MEYLAELALFCGETAGWGRRFEGDCAGLIIGSSNLLSMTDKSSLSENISWPNWKIQM